jgi:hypothetical protein
VPLGHVEDTLQNESGFTDTLVMPSQAEAGPSQKSRVRPSWWFMLAWPFGLTTWAMFVWLSILERRARWLAWAALYFVIAAIPFVVAQSWAQHHLMLRVVGFVLLPLAWAAGIAQGIAINHRINGRFARFDAPAYPVVRRPFKLYLTPPEKRLFEHFLTTFQSPRTRRVAQWRRNYGPDGSALLGVVSVWGTLGSWLGFFNIVGLVRTHSMARFLVISVIVAILWLVTMIRLRQVAKLGSVYLDGYADGASPAHETGGRTKRHLGGA